MSTQTQQSDSMSIEDHFQAFLTEYYRDDIATLAQKYPSEQKSLWIEAKDLFVYSENNGIALYDDWIDNPETMRARAESALTSVDLPVPINLNGANIRLTDSNQYIPRRKVSDLTSDDIGNYIGLTGKMEKVTAVKPLLTEASFRCLRCGTLNRVPQGRNELQEPQQCECERDGPFKPEESEFEFMDQLKIKFKAPPDEQVQTGKQTGEEKLVKVTDDLCHHGGPQGLVNHAGEDVVIFGEYKADLSQFNKRNASPEFDTWFDAKAVEFEGDENEDIDIEAHEETFKELAQRDDAVEQIAHSIAPALYREDGDELDTVTTASVAWLFNAYRLDTQWGSMRGDIHFGIFGDPGVGKSTVLRDLQHLSPKCKMRSATGMSAVGLTASAVQEEFDGKTQWALHPGILPQANGGHCIIDEIDDLVDETTKKMHDALEGEQMITIDKADISAELPTRTALLISGNPIEGRFDRFQPIAEQIGLDPALIDRMDLLFTMQDEVDEEMDRMKAKHVLESTQKMIEAELSDEEMPDDVENAREIPREVLRAWIKYAQDNVFPELTTDSRQVLEDFFHEIRQKNVEQSTGDAEDAPIPATMRSLNAAIRIAIAYARVSLSETVEERHAERAVDISKRVVGLNFDPETNMFDAGMRDTGVPKSKKDRHKMIKSILRDMQNDEEYKDKSGGIPHSDFAEVLEDQGYPIDKLDNDLHKLKNKNPADIYEPKTGEYRLA